MDGTLTQLVQALIDAHTTIAQLQARVAELEAQVKEGPRTDAADRPV